MKKAIIITLLIVALIICCVAAVALLIFLGVLVGFTSAIIAGNVYGASYTVACCIGTGCGTAAALTALYCAIKYA